MATDSQGSQRPPVGFSAADPERPPHGLEISPARSAALADLHGAIGEALRAGQSVPCVADPEGGWTSDDKTERARAAWRCLDCAAFLICDQYASRFRESGGVWAGVGFSGERSMLYLERAEPESITYEEINPHVWMDSEPEQPLTRGFHQPKEEPMSKSTARNSTACLCGCDAPTARNYRPGHDARHVSNLVRAVGEGLDKRAALKVLPTEALRVKFTRAISKKAA